MSDGEQAQVPAQGGLSAEDLSNEQAEHLPEREALSLLDPSKLLGGTSLGGAPAPATPGGGPGAPALTPGGGAPAASPNVGMGGGALGRLTGGL